jgi:hypothetical protein
MHPPVKVIFFSKTFPLAVFFVGRYALKSLSFGGLGKTSGDVKSVKYFVSITYEA